MKVKIFLRDKNVSPDFVCEILSDKLGINIENCQENLRQNGFVEADIEESKVKKLISFTEKNTFLYCEILQNNESESAIVMIRLKDASLVKPDSGCGIISSLTKLNIPNCEETFKKGEPLILNLTPEKARDLSQKLKEYPFFEVKVFLSSESDSKKGDSDIFSLSWRILKQNVPFYLFYFLFSVVFLGLSLLPIVGVLGSIFSSIYHYSVVFCISSAYMKDRNGNVKLNFSDMWNYFAPATGLYIGSFIVTILFLIAFFLIILILILVFGGTGLIFALGQGIRSEEGALAAIGVFGVIGILFGVIVALFFVAYYFYVVPLMFAKAISGGLSLSSGFFAGLYPFLVPKGFKNAFSGEYFKLGMMWFLIVSMLGLLALLLIILIITIPLSVAIFFYIVNYLAIASATFALKLKENAY
ncbi:MAG: hypothetical protein NZL90_02860 [Aquificaceae bacterium]|nr:hypothetical protein [Aquificaceae bacterium]MDW8237535.1 hypothetical protein [Aquificaceae bacterium]